VTACALDEIFSHIIIIIVVVVVTSMHTLAMLTFCAVVYGPFVMLKIVLGARVLSLVSFGCLY